MKTEITKTEIIFRIPRAKTPRPSASGKSLLVASTGGFVDSGAVIDGKPLRVAFNAVIAP